MKSLKKNEEFRNCYRKGKSFANRYLVLYVCAGQDRRLGDTDPEQEMENRLGISVSKKVGDSVVRHRIKRRIKESYRLHESMFNSGLDMAVVARVSAKDADYREIESALLYLSKKAGIYHEDHE